MGLMRRRRRRRSDDFELGRKFTTEFRMEDESFRKRLMAVGLVKEESKTYVKDILSR